MTRLAKCYAAIAMVALSACSVGPNYRRPDALTPPAFKELPQDWSPTASDAADGAWWSIYKDPVLDDLEKRIDVSNQTLKAADAAYRESKAILDAARSAFFPTAGVSGALTHGRSANLGVYDQYTASVSGSWEIDVWGKVRRTVEGDVALAQASAADLASARLSLQVSLASTYFQLRAQDQLKRLEDSAATAFQQSLKITQNQYNAGAAAQADVVNARTQMLTAQAESINTELLRTQYEHAIAVLTGQPPADFSIAPADLRMDVPVPPVGMPSALLQRRPDIAAAERNVAAANAQVGVAIASFFPNLSLSGSYGFNSSSLGSLFQMSNSVWSFGPSVADTIFDAGARSAQVAQARAAYDQSVATYRQTTLTAFQQVEDDIAALRVLSQQAVVESALVSSAEEAERLTLNQYKAGTVPYSSVILAQTTALTSEQTALSVFETRLVDSVNLISALGGGWNVAQLPGRSQVEDNSDIPLLPFSFIDSGKAP